MGFGDININLPDGENFAPSEERVNEIEKILLDGRFHLGFPWTDRKAWERILGHESGKRILQEGREAAAEDPNPRVTDEIYLSALERNSPLEFNEITQKHWSQIGLLPLVECLEPSGEYIALIEEDIEAASQLKSWIHPGNDDERGTFEGKTIFNDLISLHRASNMVAADYLLGDRLRPEIRQLIRNEVERRVFKPFRERIESGKDVYWWVTVTHNWNSVCLFCILSCALWLKEDKKERAWYVAMVEKLIKYSEEGFEESGFYTEGVSYWTYGFAHYVLAAETVRVVTGGKVDWLKQPLVERMSRFGARMEVQDRIYPSFADCKSDAVPPPWLTNWMNNRVDPSRKERSMKSRMNVMDEVHFKFCPQALLILFHQVDLDELYQLENANIDNEKDWFEDVQFLVCRPRKDANVKLAATFKGGHNGVNHNHNDLGTFTVLVGKNELLTDPGAEIYTARTFSQNRYQSDLLNSFGHPVPVVAGQLQVPKKDAHTAGYGSHAYATVLEASFTDDVDQVVLDIAKAYEVETLTKLIRTFVYDRANNGSVEVIDEVAYSTAESFETALITYSEWSHNEDGSIRISADGSAIDVVVSSDAGELAFSSCVIEESSTPTRLSWSFKEPVVEAKVTIEVKPV
jgi:hypothetical protein